MVRQSAVAGVAAPRRPVKILQRTCQKSLAGFHLFAAKADTLSWTADKLKEFGVAQIMGAHCTGIEPVYYFRERLGLECKACVVGAVGSSFELANGINAGNIAQ